MAKKLKVPLMGEKPEVQIAINKNNLPRTRVQLETVDINEVKERANLRKEAIKAAAKEVRKRIREEKKAVSENVVPKKEKREPSKKKTIITEAPKPYFNQEEMFAKLEFSSVAFCKEGYVHVSKRRMKKLEKLATGNRKNRKDAMTTKNTHPAFPTRAF